MNLFIPFTFALGAFSVLCFLTALAGPTIALMIGLAVCPLFMEVFVN